MPFSKYFNVFNVSSLINQQVRPFVFANTVVTMLPVTITELFLLFSLFIIANVGKVKKALPVRSLTVHLQILICQQNILTAL